MKIITGSIDDGQITTSQMHVSMTSPEPPAPLIEHVSPDIINYTLAVGTQFINVTWERKKNAPPEKQNRRKSD